MKINGLEYVFPCDAAKIGSIDALTISYGGFAEAEVLSSVQDAVKVLRKRGFVTRDWAGNGYRGWKTGSLRYGISNKYEDKSLLMVSGDATAMVADMVYHMGNVTRIDFAVDWIYAEPNTELRELYQQEYRLYDNYARQMYNANMYHSRGGGFTYTRGQRGKGLFFRCYDKGAEQGMGRNWWWRFEVEVKGDRANDGYVRWLAAPDRTKFCQGVVEKYIRDRKLPYPNTVGQMVEEVKLSRVAAYDPDLEKKLLWLERTVKPFLTKLRGYVTVEEIINLLDLSLEAF